MFNELKGMRKVGKHSMMSVDWLIQIFSTKRQKMQRKVVWNYLGIFSPSAHEQIVESFSFYTKKNVQITMLSPIISLRYKTTRNMLCKIICPLPPSPLPLTS